MVTVCTISVFSVDCCNVCCSIVNLCLILSLCAVSRNFSYFRLDYFNSCPVVSSHCILKIFVSVNCCIVVGFVNLLISTGCVICNLIKNNLECICSCVNLTLLCCDEVVIDYIVSKNHIDFCLCSICKCFISEKLIESCYCFIISNVVCSLYSFCLCCTANCTGVGVVAVYPFAVNEFRTGKSAFTP